MKYLLTLGSLACLVLATQAAGAPSDVLAYNEDVTRKINLEIEGVVEVVTDIKFKPEGSGRIFYYFVVPHKYEDNLVSLTAVSSTTSDDLKIEKVSASPAPLSKIMIAHNARDVSLYMITIEDASI